MDELAIDIGHTWMSWRSAWDTQRKLAIDTNGLAIDIGHT
jgi:hypothetical protein